MTTPSEKFRELITSDVLIGRSFLHRGYHILRKIGQGGMGVVYEATHSTLGTRVAIKALFLPDLDVRNQQVSVKRFIREAKLAADLVHENIARVYDLWEEQGGWFMAMEYIEGLDLSKAIEQESPFPPKKALLIARQIACALELSGKKHIVHRDIKPSNIRIKHDSGDKESALHVKVLDFGVAKHLLNPDSGDGRNQLTDVNAMVGTPLYMAPEQVSPDFAAQCRGQSLPAASIGNRPMGKGRKVEEQLIDCRADLYALGIVLYEMLSGALPFDPTNGVTARLFRDPAPLPDNLPANVRRLTLKLLERNPYHRYQAAKEVVEEIDRLVGELTGPVAAVGTKPHGATAGSREATTQIPWQATDTRNRRSVSRTAIATLLAVAIFSLPIFLWQQQAHWSGRGMAPIRTSAEKGSSPSMGIARVEFLSGSAAASQALCNDRSVAAELVSQRLESNNISQMCLSTTTAPLQSIEAHSLTSTRGTARAENGGSATKREVAVKMSKGRQPGGRLASTPKPNDEIYVGKDQLGIPIIIFGEKFFQPKRTGQEPVQRPK